MNYRIKRGEQEFGPYSLSDLQRYVQTGEVAATDVAQSEGMSDWIPVQQILGDIPIPAMAWAGAPGYSAEPEIAQEAVSLPPNLHWGWVLGLDVITRSFFNIIWALVQANWARKLSRKNTPMVLIAMYPAGMISGFIAMVIGGASNESSLAGLGSVLIFAGLICMIVGVFSIRNAMETYYNSVENIGLSLSGGMTFFFGVIYLQYHINRIARWKKTGVLS